MTFEEYHNGLRKLWNIEGGQMPFLTEVQKDNFFANPHLFFVRADDETARRIWDVMYPPPPKKPAAGEVVVDLDEWRRRIYDGGPVIPLKRHWSPEVRIGGLPPMQKQPGSVYPLSGTAADVNPHKTYLVN